MSDKFAIRCRIGQLRMPMRELVYGSIRKRNSFVVISGSESALICEEEEVDRLIPQKLLTCGNLGSVWQRTPSALRRARRTSGVGLVRCSGAGAERTGSCGVLRSRRREGFARAVENHSDRELTGRGRGAGVRLPVTIPNTSLVTQDNDHGIDPTSNSPSSSNLEGRHGLFETKLHYLEERDDEVLSRRILSLSRSNKVRSALELYMSMVLLGLRPSTHSCNSLICCLLRNGTLSDAFRVFEMMKEREMTTGHTYSLILKAVANAYGCDSALKLFMELEGEGVLKKDFDPIVYNTMISVCGKAKNWVQTEKMWRKLKEDSYNGTTVTYSLLVSTFVRCSQTELAVDAYNEMIQNGLKPGEDTMKAIIGACAKEGKWDMAYSVLTRMLDSGLNPNAIAFNALINCLGKAGEVDLAFKIYNLMKSSGHTADTYTWNALLGALYRGELYADALRLFESIKREQCSELNAHVYNIALMSCQRLGLWDRSLQLLWQMEASGMPMTTASYNHVVGACEKARKPKVSLQVFEHMIHKKITPDTFTYLSLIRACVWGSLYIELEDIVERVPPNASLYNALIDGYCLRGKIASAKKWYMRMRKSGLKPDGKTRALMLQHLPNSSLRPYARYRSRSRSRY